MVREKSAGMEIDDVGMAGYILKQLGFTRSDVVGVAGISETQLDRRVNKCKIGMSRLDGALKVAKRVLESKEGYQRQEKQLTKITWENRALKSKLDAMEMNLAGDVFNSFNVFRSGLYEKAIQFQWMHRS